MELIVLHNMVLVSSLTAWFIAQASKTVTTFWKYKQIKWSRVVGAGGMPSSHSALVVGLTAAAGLHDGLDSTMFAISFVVACIVMYDATGVRRAAGKQAKVLNQLVQGLDERNKLRAIKLNELLGHTLKEVLAGAVLGITVAAFFYMFYD